MSDDDYYRQKEAEAKAEMEREKADAAANSHSAWEANERAGWAEHHQRESERKAAHEQAHQQWVAEREAGKSKGAAPPKFVPAKAPAARGDDDKPSFRESFRNAKFRPGAKIFFFVVLLPAFLYAVVAFLVSSGGGKTAGTPPPPSAAALATPREAAVSAPAPASTPGHTVLPPVKAPGSLPPVVVPTTPIQLTTPVLPQPIPQAGGYGAGPTGGQVAADAGRRRRMGDGETRPHPMDSASEGPVWHGGGRGSGAWDPIP